MHYVYLAGEMLRNSDNQSLEEDVLDHLQKAQQAQRGAWGESERVRLGENAPAIPAEELGHTIQTQIYRQVLLGAITELWVDYLTRVEALRVSVGLEAYAQADPLVKYKSQASEMFQSLLGDIRAAVISRIFLYQPRAAAAQAETERGSARRPEPAEAASKLGGSLRQPGASQARRKVPTRNAKDTGISPVDNLKDFYYALPKVELHRHLEGSLRLRTMLEIARTQGITVPISTGSLSNLVQVQKSEPSTYQNFLAKFSTLRLFYRSPEVIYRVTREAVEDAAKDNIRYLELRFTPVALSRAERFPIGRRDGLGVRERQERGH